MNSFWKSLLIQKKNRALLGLLCAVTFLSGCEAIPTMTKNDDPVIEEPKMATNWKATGAQLAWGDMEAFHIQTGDLEREEGRQELQQEMLDALEQEFAIELPMQGEKKGTITVAATHYPEGEILLEARKLLAEKGWDLQVEWVSDYIAANDALWQGELDACFYQHSLFLLAYNAKFGADLQNVGPVYFEPLGIYPGQKQSLDRLAESDTILLPAEPMELARALRFLEEQDLLVIKGGVGNGATLEDIIENPKELQFVLLGNQARAGIEKEVAFALLGTAQAVEVGYSVAKDALLLEDQYSQGATHYGIILVSRADNHMEESVLELQNVLHSSTMKKFLTDRYKGALRSMDFSAGTLPSNVNGEQGIEEGKEDTDVHNGE